MRFLILSESADGLGFATRLLAEGHEVSMWIRDGGYSSIGEGIVDKAEELMPGAMIIADVTGFGAICDQFRYNGTLVYGGSAFADKLELDRNFAADVMLACGIETPGEVRFDNIDEAINFIRSADDGERFVFKPEGENSGNVPSYVSKGSEDIIEFMERARKLFVPGTPFILQQYIEGFDISTDAIFADDKFVRPFSHSVENKSVLDGNLGESCGCAGNIVWSCADSSCPICSVTERLEPILRRHRFVGGCDLNTQIEKETGKIYGLEFTPRFGYDSSPTLFFCCFDGDLGDFFYQCASGEIEEFPAVLGYGTAVRISIPPYPSGESAAEGIEVGGLSKGDFARFYPYGVSMRDGKLVTAGSAGNVGAALGFDTNLQQSWEFCYEIADKIELQKKQYRLDLPEVTGKHLRNVVRVLATSVRSR